jgi:HSP20 family protein
MLTLWNAFDDMFAEDPWLRAARPRREYRPAVDVVENERHFLITADVPGLGAEELDITVDNNVLTVSGERKFEKKDEHQGYQRVERHYGSFRRSLTLPEGVNQDGIEANVENGILTVQVPKPVAALPKKVQVKASGLATKAKKLFTKSAEEAAPPAS